MKKHDMLLLGTKLKELRRAKKMTMAELAWRSDCSVPALYTYERNESVPTIAALQAIAAILEVDVGDLARYKVISDERRTVVKDQALRKRKLARAEIKEEVIEDPV